jgi:hypothetical protein
MEFWNFGVLAAISLGHCISRSVSLSCATRVFLTKTRFRLNSTTINQHSTSITFTMDSDPPPEPVVIPFNHVTHRTGNYTCSQDGLEFEAYEYDDHRSGQFATSPPPAEPFGGWGGPPKWAPMPKEWWQAQCAFRGLSTDGTIGELQSTIKEHEHEGMTEELRDFEIQAIKEFRVQNADVTEQMWLHEMSNEKKAESNPRSVC